MLKKWLSVLCLLPMGAAQVWALNLEELSARLDRPSLVAGSFEQEKFLVGFPKPLKTQGVYTFWANHGIVWETKTPFNSKMILTPTQLRSVTDYQQRAVSSEDNPHLKVLNQLLIGLMQGDVKVISEHFNIGLKETNNLWQMLLMPKDKNIKMVFVKILIEGDKEVKALRFYSPNGDLTVIHLKDEHEPKNIPQDLQIHNK